MILGDVCTRSCRFCATQTGKPLPPDPGEPESIADSIRIMGLKHALITSVTRDDLEDGGASHWAGVIRAVRRSNPDITIEILIPDLDGRPELIDIILEAAPDIVGHNIETVARLTPHIRSRARYGVSLETLRHIASRGFVAKSGIMLGLGENEDELFAAMDDLADAGCKILTLGQYLQPTRGHVPVQEYVTPGKFEFYGDIARMRGFTYVASGPLVRSSYMAEQALGELKKGPSGPAFTKCIILAQACRRRPE